MVNPYRRDGRLWHRYRFGVIGRIQATLKQLHPIEEEIGGDQANESERSQTLSRSWGVNVGGQSS
jgi:hypothetical protein